MNELTTVSFHGHNLFAEEREDDIHVAIKPICEQMTVQWEAQLKRIKRDQILREGMSTMDIPTAGGMQQTTSLPLRLLAGWLFGIHENLVKDPRAKEWVLLFKREGHDALYRRFFGPRHASDIINELIRRDEQRERQLTDLSISLAAIVSELAEAKRLSDPRHVLRDGVYARELVIEALKIKDPKKGLKGLKGLEVRISNECTKFGRRQDPPIEPQHDYRGTRVFDRRLATKFMYWKGNAICEAYISPKDRGPVTDASEPLMPKGQLDLFSPKDGDKPN